MLKEVNMRPEGFSDRLWEFAARVGEIIDALPDTRLGRHVAGQLVRCGTASAPNYDEGRSAESRDDFVHKLGIATKEMRESFGWLRFVVRAGLLPQTKMAALIDESEQLLKMLSKSVHTARPRPDVPPPKQPTITNQQSPIRNTTNFKSHLPGFTGFDHLAIVVPDTEMALGLWRDVLGFPVLYSEDVNGGTVRLTHLDLGNAQLQLVQPLTPDHPLQAWLAKNGPGLHHFCLRVEDIDVAMRHSPVPTAPTPHQGTHCKRALFLDKAATHGVLIELTGK
jgi:methylmalonyl-CoA/ethylmalonyl-CoA epimerase